MEQFDGIERLRCAAAQAQYLTLDEERQLTRAVKAGSRAALDRLLRAHLRLVLVIANELAKGSCSKDELVSEGLLGLTLAARRFDPERGTRFAIYAAYWVRACILRFRHWNRRIVRAPSTRNARTLVSRLPKLERVYFHEHGRAPSTEVIAQACGIDLGEVRELAAAMYGRDVPCSTGESDRGADLPSETPLPEALVADAEAARAAHVRVHAALAQLPSRERAIVELRHLADEPPTFGELGRDFGVSSERARQLEVKARDRLRQLLEVA